MLNVGLVWEGWQIVGLGFGERSGPAAQGVGPKTPPVIAYLNLFHILNRGPGSILELPNANSTWGRRGGGSGSSTTVQSDGPDALTYQCVCLHAHHRCEEHFYTSLPGYIWEHADTKFRHLLSPQQLQHAQWLRNLSAAAASLEAKFESNTSNPMQGD